MCNSQLSKSKSEIKNSTETILRLLSNVSGDSNGKTNFPHKSFLTSARVCRLRKAFADFVKLSFLGPSLLASVNRETDVAGHVAPILAKKKTRCFVNNGTKHWKAARWNYYKV